MDNLTGLNTVLHMVSQSSLPVIIFLLLLFILTALITLGSLIAEYFLLHRKFKAVRPSLLNDVATADYQAVEKIIAESSLFKSQKNLLISIFAHDYLSEEALLAYASKLLNSQKSDLSRRLAISNFIAKAAPMLGLMGTLIPLGPGIVALGQGDTQLLSQSIMTAFDTTVAGLIAALIALLISSIRKRWYVEYLDLLNNLVAVVLDKVTRHTELVGR